MVCSALHSSVTCAEPLLHPGSRHILCPRSGAAPRCTGRASSRLCRGAQVRQRFCQGKAVQNLIPSAAMGQQELLILCPRDAEYLSVLDTLPKEAKVALWAVSCFLHLHTRSVLSWLVPAGGGHGSEC